MPPFAVKRPVKVEVPETESVPEFVIDVAESSARVEAPDAVSVLVETPPFAVKRPVKVEMPETESVPELVIEVAESPANVDVPLAESVVVERPPTPTVRVVGERVVVEMFVAVKFPFASIDICFAPLT